MLARFEREVQATAKLSHWNSVYIYDYGHTADGTLYYVMGVLARTDSARTGHQVWTAAPGSDHLSSQAGLLGAAEAMGWV